MQYSLASNCGKTPQPHFLHSLRERLSPCGQEPLLLQLPALGLYVVVQVPWGIAVVEGAPPLRLMASSCAKIGWKIERQASIRHRGEYERAYMLIWFGVVLRGFLKDRKKEQDSWVDIVHGNTIVER